MIALASHFSNPDREEKLYELVNTLSEKFPKLSESITDFESLGAFALNSELYGANHAIWLTDGNKTGPTEIPKSTASVVENGTFALQLEAIIFDSEDGLQAAWNVLSLNVFNNYEPTEVVSTIEDFAFNYNSHELIYYIAHKTNQKPTFDIRTKSPKNIEQFSEAFNLIYNKAYIISVMQDLTEFNSFMNS